MSDELTPAMMVAEATAETADEVCDVLVHLLADPSMPEEMRRDMRSRIADLHRRFPDLDSEHAASG